ncbi:MAG: hypothetical protein AB1772_05200 [Candidatus Zixiibacteriota bacterium]
MAKMSFALVVGMVCLVIAGPVTAHWVPSDGHKMHWPQLPDEQGWDVNAVYPVVLADDWQCSETGPVTDIHFWGSWRDLDGDQIGDVGTIQSFQIGIWSDVPDPDGSGPLFSHPGNRLWFQEVSDFLVQQVDPPTIEAWYDPSKEPDVIVPNDHKSYFQYNIFFDQAGLPPFPQQQGTIYWLSISAVLAPSPITYEWGWKSSIDHFNDDAVWAVDGPTLNWTDIYEPPRVNYFDATINPDGTWGGGNGTNYYGQGWYFYPSGWWNIWFYDNPFTTTRPKVGFFQCFLQPVDPLLPNQVTVALNWSTAAWSQQEPPPDGPPLPGVDEALYIGRQVIFNGPIPPEGLQLTETFNWPFNPEWVSVDIMGRNFIVRMGVISHECYRTSLDLAFVVTGSAPTGACCYPNGSCAVVTQAACVGGPAGGTYLGDGTVCLGDANGNGVDDACEGVAPTGACCYPNGSCAVVTQAACVGGPVQGIYLGDGTVCLGDANGNGVDDACEGVTPTGACCYPNGSCAVVTQAACVGGPVQGIYLGDGTVCLGDANGNGVDDACEQVLPQGACCRPDGTCYVTTAGLCTGAYLGDGTVCAGDNNGNGADDACENPQGELKWYQPPDFQFGDDVNCTYPPGATSGFLLAADFQCQLTGPITEIRVFGSWWHDYLPFGDPRRVRFVLSIHEDIPATGEDYSRPGNLICRMDSPPFVVVPIATNLQEGWFNPPSTWFPYPNGDAVCWQYTFDVSEFQCFQFGTVAAPKVYWLDVQAYPEDQAAVFGWKTSMPPWNDDAVWAAGVDDGSTIDWNELIFPSNHWYYAGRSADLAFGIYGVAGQPPTGACCYPNGSCAVVTQPDCTSGGGTYLGNGTACLGDVNPPNGVDDACEGVVPTGACCFDNGSCQLMMQAACAAAGGTYAGNGTVCAGDANMNGVDDACEGVVTMGACCYGDAAICVNTISTVCSQTYNGTWYAGQNCATFQCPVEATGACCYPDGSCTVVTQADCAASQGIYKGDGTTCVDVNGNGIADICETLEHLKWVQPPDLTPMGMDVMATQRVVLADDFQCTETGQITKVVVYGSWFQDMVPDHSQVYFILSFHEDIPAAGEDYSRPGTLNCLTVFAPGTYRYEPLPIALNEGWYDPSQELYLFPGDHQIFMYTFEIEDPCWRQTGTPSAPKVYWLDVQVQMPLEGPMFGWKTSREHWNDDAVWTLGQEPDQIPGWIELRYPLQHPLFPMSVDLAFEIYGVTAPSCCVGRVGDANSSGDDDPTIGDVTTMIDAKFITGTCDGVILCLPEADINQSGGANPTCDDITIGDITVLIDYLFITGQTLGLPDCL